MHNPQHSLHTLNAICIVILYGMYIKAEAIMLKILPIILFGIAQNFYQLYSLLAPIILRCMLGAHAQEGYGTCLVCVYMYVCVCVCVCLLQL